MPTSPKLVSKTKYRLHRLRYLSAMTAIALLLVSPVILYAQEAGEAPQRDDDAPALWEFRFAAFGRYAPVYPGSDESDLTLLPIPIPVYRGAFLNFGENLDQVARGEISQTKRTRLGVDLDFTFGEHSSDIAVRRGMPDLDFMFEIGPELEIKLDDRAPEDGEFLLALQLRAAVSFDGLSPSSQGYMLNPEFEYRLSQAFGGDNLLSLRWKPTWASERFMDYYYEVAPAYATPERPAYDAVSGYLGSRFTVALTRQIHEKLILGVSASYYLNSGAENEASPLHRSNSGASIQAALVWTLAESERRARTRSRRE
jgi:outer membrane scaffolding protein for murein synthesis (MipA/OmpV family)